MGKYTELQDGIFSIFGGADWLAESISTYPQNFIPQTASTEFIRVSILSGTPGINLESVEGQILIDIFIAAGDGPTRLTAIADALDLHFVGKLIDAGAGKVQFHKSVLGTLRSDADDSSLQSAVYSIPFNYFGV